MANNDHIDWIQEIISKNKIRFPGPRNIECSLGWKELIEDFFIELDRLDQKFKINIFVIKEKFGLMRIQTDCPIDDLVADDFYKLVDKYEKLSRTICEECGNPGKLDNKSHWFKVRCKSCQ